MQNVGALRMLGDCSTRCHLKMWSLEHHDIGTSEMWSEGTWTISTNATGRCAARLCYFCGGAESMSQHGCN